MTVFVTLCLAAETKGVTVLDRDLERIKLAREGMHIMWEFCFAAHRRSWTEYAERAARIIHSVTRIFFRWSGWPISMDFILRFTWTQLLQWCSPRHYLPQPKFQFYWECCQATRKKSGIGSSAAWKMHEKGFDKTKRRKFCSWDGAWLMVGIPPEAYYKPLRVSTWEHHLVTNRG